MSPLLHHLKELGDGPLAWSLRLTGLSVIVWAVLRVACSLLRLVVPFKRTRGDQFTRAGLGLLLAHTTAFIAFEGVTRTQHLRVVFDHTVLDRSQTARAIAESFSAQFIGVAFWAISSLLGLLGYAIARWVEKKTRPLRPWEAIAFALWAVVAQSSFQQINVLVSGSNHHGVFDRHDKDRLLDEVLADALVPMERGIWVIGGVCLVGGCLWVWRSRVRADLAPSSVRAPLLVFGLGSCAFLSTRPHHAAARHLVRPRLEPPYACDYAHLPELPARTGKAKAAFVEGPLVLIESPTKSRIDGLPAGPQEFVSALQAKREVWQQLKPNVAFPGIVVVAAPPGLPMRDMVDWLEAAATSGYSEVHALLSSPRESFDSPTLGRLQREPTCSTVRVGPPFPSGVTWAEHVAKEEE